MAFQKGKRSKPEFRTRMHRLREVRLRQKLSLDEMASRLGKSAVEVALDEEPCTDISISTLRQWQDALHVALHDLLIDADDPMALPGLTTERMERMETVASKIAKSAKQDATRTFAEGLRRQIRELIRDEPPSDEGFHYGDFLSTMSFSS